MRNIRFGIGLAVMGISGCGTIDGTPFDLTYREAPPTVPDLPEPPEDARPVVTAETRPVPVSGGTLLVTADGALAVAADPDRDRVSIVSLGSKRVLHTVSLAHRDEPGRVVEGAPGRAHVVLRGAGEIATIDLAAGTVVTRYTACSAPRGAAYDGATGTLHVACASGVLVSMSASDGTVSRRLDLGADLRDVVLRPDGLLLTRFKSGSLVHVDTSGNVVGDVVGTSILRVGLKPRPQEPEGAGGAPASEPVELVPTEEELDPAVLVRPVPSPDGRVHLVHQYELDEPIRLPDPEEIPDPLGQASYGAPPGGCGGLVQAGVSRLEADGRLVMGRPLTAPPLTVDGAVSYDGKWIALAHAGTQDPEAPTLFGFSTGLGRGAITLLPADEPGAGTLHVDPGACFFGSRIAIDGQTTAVAFNTATGQAAIDSEVWLVVQTREPAALFLLRDPMGQTIRSVPLGGPSMLDTGHEIFHRDAGGGIACASCHVEGGEDGRVWKFVPLGDRRTQAVNVGLDGTAPFHWDGDMKDLDTLMAEVFVGRMGGAKQSAERVASLSRFIGGLTPPARIVPEDDERALRGKVLFDSAQLACATCHAGEKLTSNVSYNVGTTSEGHSLQVPSLIGVGYRAPFLHDGCAPTLVDRFDPACGGGDRHGRTSGLAEGERADLVTYLNSL